MEKYTLKERIDKKLAAIQDQIDSINGSIRSTMDFGEILANVRKHCNILPEYVYEKDNRKQFELFCTLWKDIVASNTVIDEEDSFWKDVLFDLDEYDFQIWYIYSFDHFAKSKKNVIDDN